MSNLTFWEVALLDEASEAGGILRVPIAEATAEALVSLIAKGMLEPVDDAEAGMLLYRLRDEFPRADAE